MKGDQPMSQDLDLDEILEPLPEGLRQQIRERLETSPLEMPGALVAELLDLLLAQLGVPE